MYDLIIKKDMSDSISTGGSVYIKRNVIFKGDLTAKVVVVEGVVHGSIISSEEICLRKTATMRGNLTAPSVIIDEGAKLFGSVTFLREEAQTQKNYVDLFKGIHSN